MYNVGDRVLVLRNGHWEFVGDAVGIDKSSGSLVIKFFRYNQFSYMMFDRISGKCTELYQSGAYSIKPLPSNPSKNISTCAENFNKQLQIEVNELNAALEREKLLERAREWYDTLSTEQKQMVDALAQTWVAVG